MVPVWGGTGFRPVWDRRVPGVGPIRVGPVWGGTGLGPTWGGAGLGPTRVGSVWDRHGAGYGSACGRFRTDLGVGPIGTGFGAAWGDNFGYQNLESQPLQA